MIVLESYLAIALTLATILGSVIFAFYTWRKNTRESTDQIILLLKTEVERLEVHSQELRDERDKMEHRITELERDYRNLVLTVTTMGFCANAPTCPSHDAGDRRNKASSKKRPSMAIGGTD